MGGGRGGGDFQSTVDCEFRGRISQLLEHALSSGHLELKEPAKIIVCSWLQELRVLRPQYPGCALWQPSDWRWPHSFLHTRCRRLLKL